MIYDISASSEKCQRVDRGGKVRGTFRAWQLSVAFSHIYGHISKLSKVLEIFLLAGRCKVR